MKSATSATRRWLPLIIGIAVGIRIALAVALGPHEAGKAGHLWFPDSADYDQLARNMFEHQPYEVGGNYASRMPGYPVFVAMVYAVCGYSTQAVLIVQALLGGGIVVLAYAIGRRGGVAVGLIAALLATFDPLSIGFGETILSETGFTFLLMLALWLMIRMTEFRRITDEISAEESCPESANERRSRSTAKHFVAIATDKIAPTTSHLRFVSAWVGLGLIWGAAVYFRASALWCIVPLAGLTAWAVPGSSSWQRLAAPVIVVSIVFLTLAPWLIRNYHIFGSGPLRLTTLEGISLYEAVYPDADGGPKQDQISSPSEILNLDEAQRNDEWSHRAWAYIRQDPARILRLALIKFGRTWSPWFNLESLRNPLIQAAMILWHVPLFILGLLGLFTGPLPRNTRLLLVVPLGYFSMVHSLFLGSIRYRVPLMPIVCIAAAAGIVILYNWLFPAQRTIVAGV